MKDYTITKEFFGGILRNNHSRINMTIDDLLYDYFLMLEQKISYKEFYSKYSDSINLEEFLEILLDSVKENYLISNVFVQENDVINGVLSAPLRVFYDITYLCNLRCKHCFTRSGNANANELTLEEKYDLLNQLVKLGVPRISIAGGEPFACPDLFPFLERCKELGIGVSISTNATLLTKEILERLNELSIKTLTISFDGGTEEEMDFTRGKKSYFMTIRGLKNIKKYYQGNYSIKATLMKCNINSLKEIIDLAIEYACNSIKFNCVRADGRAIDNAETIVLTQEEYINTVKSIEVFKKEYKDKIIIKGPLNIFCDEPYDFINELGFGCFAGKESICIDPLGNVKPCTHFPDSFICGNIKTQDLSDIWENSDVLSIFREVEGNNICMECKGYNMCRSGCRYRAFCNGDIKGIDPYCFMEKNKV